MKGPKGDCGPRGPRGPEGPRGLPGPGKCVVDKILKKLDSLYKELSDLRERQKYLKEMLTKCGCEEKKCEVEKKMHCLLQKKMTVKAKIAKKEMKLGNYLQRQ